MNPLFTVKDMRKRYGCSQPTARKYIRQCNPHMENPLATTEAAVIEWEESRTVQKKAPYKNYNKRKVTGEKVIVPRRR